MSTRKKNSKIKVLTKFTALFGIVLFFAYLTLLSIKNPSGQVASATTVLPQPPAGQLWHYQCIDTMKYTRDAARQYTGNLQKASTYIQNEVATIKELGANCIAIGTPYDQEFWQLLSVFADEAHRQGLVIWFRGNFSGWEQWFSYPRLSSADEHHKKLQDFISKNANLFAEGDILSPAPEAENGLLGNPWRSWEARSELRDFAYTSTETCQQAILAIQKKVHCGYFSANGDVAREIYDQKTLQKAGAVTVIDHYVASSERMGRDLSGYASRHGLPIFVGEFGAPIPDINGNMSETEQAEFVKSLMWQFYYHQKDVIGLNYWVLKGGSTRLLNDDGSERAVTKVLRDFYNPGTVRGTVVDGLNRRLANVKVSTSDGIQESITNSNGDFYFSAPKGRVQVFVHDQNYVGPPADVEFITNQESWLTLRVDPTNPSLWYRAKARLLATLPQ